MKKEEEKLINIKKITLIISKFDICIGEKQVKKRNTGVDISHNIA